MSDYEKLDSLNEIYQLKYNKTSKLVAKIKQILKKIKDIWISRPFTNVTLQYISRIGDAIDFYYQPVNKDYTEFNDINRALIFNTRICFVFSQKINIKKISVPRNFNEEQKKEYNKTIQDLIHLWNELGKIFSFDRFTELFKPINIEDIKKICNNSIYNFNDDVLMITKGKKKRTLKQIKTTPIK
jgi:hypothetical protein